MRVLGVFAHPDDELLWGFPMMQYDDVDRYLMTVSDNHDGYDYHAKLALGKVCKTAGIRLVECLGLPSEYYRVCVRHGSLTLMQDVVPTIVAHLRRALDEVKPDRVITHNPFGEYGHGDHRLLFNIVTTLPETDGVEVMFTDACQLNKCHLSFGSVPRRVREAYYRNRVDEYTLNTGWFKPLRKIYEDHGAWSWTGHDVIEKVGVYVC